MSIEDDDQHTPSRPDDAQIAQALDAAFGKATGDEALREGPRLFFAAAAEVARAQYDPAQKWAPFVEALWEQLDAGFGLTPDDPAVGLVPRAWFDAPDDPAVIVWDGDGSTG